MLEDLEKAEKKGMKNNYLHKIFYNSHHSYKVELLMLCWSFSKL
jgi:hypothetical protein